MNANGGVSANTSPMTFTPKQNFKMANFSNPHIFQTPQTHQAQNHEIMESSAKSLNNSAYPTSFDGSTLSTTLQASPATLPPTAFSTPEPNRKQMPDQCFTGTPVQG